MATITIEIPEGKKAEWVNGVLTLIDEQPVEFKFGFDDKVRFKGGYKELTIYRREAVEGKPHYWLKDENEVPYPNYSEDDIELYTEQPKDITDRIKTFEDAYRWCCENKAGLVHQYNDALNVGLQRAKDILAYLKLRIITCALNEGWKPTFDNGEERYYVSVSIINNKVDLNSLCVCDKNCGIGYNESYKLFFKSSQLAEYAATQFKDIYMDFCHKGKE